MISLNMAPLRNNPVFLGVAFAVLQSVQFSVMGAIVRGVADVHHPVESMFYRSFVCLILAFAALVMAGKLHRLRGANMKAQTMRGLVGSFGMLLTFMAFAMLPLSEVQSILFAAPIFVVALSWPVLKEKVGKYRIGAALAGFCGILLIVQPGAISSLGGGMVALCAAFFHAAVILILRKIGKSEDALVTVFFFSLISTLSTLPALPFFFTMPTGWLDLAALLSIGALAFGLQYCLTKSYTYADATVIAPVTYLNMIWALLLDYMLWHHVPSAMVIVGALIIISSNCVIIWRESIKRKNPAPQITPESH